MKKILIILFVLGFMSGCLEAAPNSDRDQQRQQERILQEGAAQTGMPSIKNFREKKIMKMIYELRDQENISTYTYIVAEQAGKLIFLGESIGYAIPAATQYTNPQKIADSGHQYRYAILPQADPNGLFSPQAAEGSWVMMKGPDDKAHAVYIEPRVIVSPFKLSGSN